MENNLVSICVTTFNRKEFLKLTLNSILAQTYKNIEVLVVDDCSNDGTKELIENKFLNIDKRIKYFRHENNKGLAVARNTAIINSKGKYFTFCDDDDNPPSLDVRNKEVPRSFLLFSLPSVGLVRS